MNKTLAERIKEVETCMNKIETLNKKIVELETEYSAAVANSTEMTNKNHELGKLLYKMQDSINKKEQVYKLFIHLIKLLNILINNYYINK